MTASVASNRASPLTSGKSALMDCEEDHSNHQALSTATAIRGRAGAPIKIIQNPKIGVSPADVLRQM
ncbi:hypothetical protein [Mycobacteroides franklinii]|uniref:hypothetical protein n=1 Tax=Mycobacteroides franklinii TaxID=948102 RepID=UPI001066E293|nr:hypothetical protein [Mycobacteroides franklinii]